MILSCNLKRICELGVVEDFTRSNYIYKRDGTMDKMDW